MIFSYFKHFNVNEHFPFPFPFIKLARGASCVGHLFLLFKHYFIFFNINEKLTVPIVKLARGGSHVGHLFRLFTLDYLSEHPTVTQL